MTNKSAEIKNMPLAVIFDLDGVITDTADFHYMAWKELANSLSIDFDIAFNENLKGVSRMESLERILNHGGISNKFNHEEKIILAESKNEKYKKLISEMSPDNILGGIKELFKILKKNDIKIGLASASKNAFDVLVQLQMTESFDYIADAKKIKNSKPAPDVFLVVANALGISPEFCIGIEDAEAGIEAIKRANMFAVGVGNEKSLANADYIVSETSFLEFNTIIEKYDLYMKSK